MQNGIACNGTRQWEVGCLGLGRGEICLSNCRRPRRGRRVLEGKELNAKLK